MTAGALRAARELGLRIPDDVALVGFDDLDWTTLVDPPITVVAQPVAELGRAAGERLLARLRGDDRSAARGFASRTRLIVRGSCGARRVSRAAAELLGRSWCEPTRPTPTLEPGGAGEAAGRAITRRPACAHAGLEVDMWDVAPGRPNVVGDAARDGRRRDR